MMESGKVDVIDIIFKIDEWEKIYEFLSFYVVIEVLLFFYESISGIVDVVLVKGFLIGVKDGDVCIDFLIVWGVINFK